MRRLLLLPLLLLPLLPIPGVAQEPPNKAIVIGEGDRLSGRIRIAHLGTAEDDLGREVDRFVRQIRERTDLDLTATHFDTLAGKVPDAEILVHPRDVSPADAGGIRKYERVKGGLARRVYPEREPTSTRLLEILREAIRRSRSIRHVPTVFESIVGEVSGGRLFVRVLTVLDGTVTLDAVNSAGEAVVPESPLRPLDLDAIPDWEDTIVRLRWKGEGGLREEARIWLPDLSPELVPGVEVLGGETAYVGFPWRCRVLVRAGRRPVPGVEVMAKLGDREIRATTDPAGSAVIEFPPFEAVGDGQAQLLVTVNGPRISRRLTDFIVVAPRKITAHLGTDRPVCRPGTQVKLRAIVTDSWRRHGLAGQALKLRLLDPRARMLASAEATTDARGVATFEVPLADGIAEGEYRAVVRGDGAFAECTLRVEEIRLSPFEVEAEPGKEVFDRGETVFGTVHARALTGEPIRSVRAECRWRTGGSVGFRLGADGSGEFRIDPPRRSSGKEALTIRVVHGGLWVEQELRVAFAPGADDARPAPERRIEAPEEVRVGSALPVRVRLDGEDGPVLFDVLAAHGLLAAFSGEIRGGVAEFEVEMPDGFAGPVRLVARRPGGKGVSRTVTVADPLDVKVDLSERESRPGEQFVLGVRVNGDSGERVPAVLDVLGFDRAYLAAVGEGGNGAPRLLRSGVLPNALWTLVGATPRDAYHAFTARCEAAAKPVLGEALRRLANGGDVGDLRLPWGTRLSAWQEGDSVHVAGGGPVTTRELNEELEFIGWPPRDPTVIGELTTPLDGLPAAHVLPPRGRAGSRSWDSIDHGFEWLPHHQSPDGSFDPVGFARMCLPAGCGGEGDPRLAPGTTGAVVLAYLGAGETHKHGRYKRVVRAALRFLKLSQDEEGLFCDPGNDWGRLNHAMATLAMCEAYGLTLSPLFKSSAQRGVDALAGFQREDGAFSEAGWEDGSLILTAWAALAFHSAQIAGLSVPEGALAAIARWADEHADEGTGVVPCSEQEIDEYPFSRTRPSPGPAGMTAMIRISTEGRRARWHRGLDVTSGLPEIPPPTAETGLHDLWWGSMAAFRIGGKTWDAYNDAMREVLIPGQNHTGCRKGSFPPGESRIGRPAATAFAGICLQVYYRYSRVFGGAGGAFGGGGPGLGRPRSNFPDLLVSDLAVPTDENGRATIPLDLPDSVTTWALRVGAWDGKGRYGRAETALTATLPLEVFFDVPPRLREGDVLALPVRVRSRGDADETVAVSVSTSEHLEVVGKTSREVGVKAGGTATVRFAIEAKKPGKAKVTAVAGGKEPDAITRTVEVLSNRHPFTLRSPLPLGVDRAIGSRVATVIGSPRAHLQVRTSPLGDAEEALKGLVRRPTGCFEQTAAKLYPSLLAYRYLKRIGAADARFEARAMESLRIGYQKLLSYEVEGGGFSMWGRHPDRPDCNALAIHLLSDLSEVMEVDRGVIDRAADRLAAVLPPEKAAAERVYAVAALRRAGRKAEEGVTLGRDPYPVALAAVHGLLPEEALAGARSQIEESNWETGGPTLFAGRNRDPDEVRAVCTRALALLGGDPVRVRKELARLRSEQAPDGGWATTRGTVAALSCLSSLVSEGRVRGVLTIRRPGQADLAVPLDTGLMGESFDLGSWDSRLRLRADFEGTGTPFLTVILNGLSAAPPATSGEIAAEVRWPTEPVNAALPVEVTVSLANTTRETVHAPTLSIPLPAGFRASRESLAELVRFDRFSRAEVVTGRIHLYLHRLAPRARVEGALILTPAFEGAFRISPARAYPYYRPESASLTAGGTLRVHR